MNGPNTMLKYLYLGTICLLTPSIAFSQTGGNNNPTNRVPMCLQYPNSKTYVPCTGVVPVDKTTGEPLSWQDLLSNSGGGGGGGGTPDANAGSSSTTAKSVQNADGSKIASENTVNGLFKAGQTIGNTAFGISGTLPAFSSTPTFNIGTAPNLNVVNLTGTNSIGTVGLNAGTNAIGSITNTGFASTQSGTWNLNNITGAVSLPTGASTSVKQDELKTALGSPFQAGGSIGNTVFGSTQSGFWDVRNITGTLSLPTGAATAAKQDSLLTALGSPFQVGGSIANTVFGSTQSGTWNVGLNAGSNVVGSIANSSFGSNCLVVTGDQAYTVGDQRQCTMAPSGGVKVGLSSSTNINPAAPTTGNLNALLSAGKYYASRPTWADGNTGALQVDSTGNLYVNNATLPPGSATDTTVNTLFKAGQSIGNTTFGAKLQDASGAALGTSGNPVYVSGGGGTPTPTGTAGSPNTSVVTVQGIAGGVAQAVTNDGVVDGFSQTVTGTSAGALTPGTASSIIASNGIINTSGYGVIYLQIVNNTGSANWTLEGSNSSDFSTGTVQIRFSEVGNFSTGYSTTVSTTTGTYMPLYVMPYMRVVKSGGASALNINVALKRYARDNYVQIASAMSTLTVVRSNYSNETTTAQAANATFNGASRDTGVATTNTQWNNFSCFARSDQSGTINQQGSNDNTTWYTEITQAVAANTPVTTTGRVFTRYHRCQYVNGATAQTSFFLNSQIGG